MPKWPILGRLALGPTVSLLSAVFQFLWYPMLEIKLWPLMGQEKDSRLNRVKEWPWGICQCNFQLIFPFASQPFQKQLMLTISEFGDASQVVCFLHAGYESFFPSLLSELNSFISFLASKFMSPLSLLQGALSLRLCDLHNLSLILFY